MGTKKKSSGPRKKRAAHMSSEMDVAISMAEFTIEHWSKELQRLQAKKKVLDKKATGNELTKKDVLLLLPEDSEPEARRELQVFCEEIGRVPFAWGEQEQRRGGYFLDRKCDKAGLYGVTLWNEFEQIEFTVDRYGLYNGTPYIWVSGYGDFRRALEEVRHLDDTTPFSQIWAVLTRCRS